MKSPAPCWRKLKEKRWETLLLALFGWFFDSSHGSSCSRFSYPVALDTAYVLILSFLLHDICQIFIRVLIFKDKGGF